VLLRIGLLAVLAALIAAGCAGTREAERPDGPFQIVIVATTDTQGELEPCG
jgi:hypothetical protein